MPWPVVRGPGGGGHRRGRGLGREHALLLAAQGAKVVVNDIGADVDGTAGSSLAGEVVADDHAGGRRGRRQRRRRQRLGRRQGHGRRGGQDLRQARHPRQQRRHPARPDARQHGRGRVGRRHPGAPEGHIRPLPPRRRLLAGREQVGGPVKGRIINTSSTSGIYGNVGQTNYGAAKAGIAAFTIIAAREMRRYGVTVNAISPRRRRA